MVTCTKKNLKKKQKKKQKKKTKQSNPTEYSFYEIQIINLSKNFVLGFLTIKILEIKKL